MSRPICTSFEGGSPLNSTLSGFIVMICMKQGVGGGLGNKSIGVGGSKGK